MEDRIKNVMASVLEISNEEINDDSSPDTIDYRIMVLIKTYEFGGCLGRGIWHTVYR